MFKRRRFPVDIILVCVRWYCKYGISYRDLAEMMQERGVDVDPSTIMRWVHRYAPELEKRVRWYQGYRATSWRVDETYVKVGGHWKYLFRAVDKHGRLIDFMLQSGSVVSKFANSFTLCTFGDIHRGVGGAQQAGHTLAILRIHRNPNTG
jgi:transposase-like protein